MCGIGLYRKGVVFSPVEQEKLRTTFDRTQSRGPDRSAYILVDPQTWIGFHRLAIMDPSVAGDQPFVHHRSDGSVVYCLCNGEIFNYKDIVESEDLTLKSGSDCEVILHLYLRGGMEYLLDRIRGEFAFVVYDTGCGALFAARDPIGVRPLFLGQDEDGSIGLCSEMKGLVGLYDSIDQFTPGQWMAYDIHTQGLQWHSYYDYVYPSVIRDQDTVYDDIRRIFMQAVSKRLMSDRPLGCLLSGGLDSSICAAIAAHYSDQPLHTFTIGMEGATDVPYAQMVADHIGSVHTSVVVDVDDALAVVAQTIYAIESYDITTVRASVWQYLLGKYIAAQTDIKVLICGELSDELMSGYKYFHKAPDAAAMHRENIRLVRDIHRYDGLRTDRTMAAHGLEVRLPFADVDFVDYILSLDPAYRMPQDGVEKYLFRKAFDSTGLLPSDVLWRSKEALSDGTSSQKDSWFSLLQDHIDTIVSDEEFMDGKKRFVHCPPLTKEAYYYRLLFDQYFGDKHSGVIPYFWLPKWCGDVTDPSARVLTDVYT